MPASGVRLLYSRSTPMGLYDSGIIPAAGGFPVHTPDKIAVKDTGHRRDCVKAPGLKFPQGLWDAAKGMREAMDRYNRKEFSLSQADIGNARLPMNDMF